MDDNTTVPPEYQKRFNEGYTIAKYMPELAEQLSAAIQNYSHGAGFQQGRTQFLQEQAKQKLPSWLKGERSAKEDTSPGKQKDKDMEPEL